MEFTKVQTVGTVTIPVKEYQMLIEKSLRLRTLVSIIEDANKENALYYQRDLPFRYVEIMKEEMKEEEF